MPGRILGWAGAAMLAACGWAEAQAAYPTIDTVPKEHSSGPVRFQKVKIANAGIIESCAFGDFNGDHIMDIVSGNDWFEGPGFTIRHTFRLLSTADRTTPDDMTVSLDADGDGYDDVISGGHNIGLFFYANPGKAGGPWKRSAIDAERPPDGHVDTAISAGLPHALGWHSGGLVDVDGDGKAQELLSTGVRADARLNMRWWKFAKGAWVKHDLGEKCEMWGSGVGDLNGDGRPDVLCPDAWLEGPADPVAGKWIKHPFPVDICNVASEPEPKIKNALGATIGHATQIYAYDVNGDGLKDILLSSGHGNGIFWYQQARTPAGGMTFLEHIIDRSWYQSHNLEFKDIDGDGNPDLVSGKRWNGWGPNNKVANNVYWYQLIPGAANPWKRHVISYDEKIGMGNKGDVRDFDGDGDMDVLATSGDVGGTYLFVSQRNPVTALLPAPKKARGPQPSWRWEGIGYLLPGAPDDRARDAAGRLQAGRINLPEAIHAR